MLAYSGRTVVSWFLVTMVLTDEPCCNNRHAKAFSSDSTACSARVPATAVKRIDRTRLHHVFHPCATARRPRLATEARASPRDPRHRLFVQNRLFRCSNKPPLCLIMCRCTSADGSIKCDDLSARPSHSRPHRRRQRRVGLWTISHVATTGAVSPWLWRASNEIC